MVSRRIEIRMWAEACKMLRQAEQMHRQFFRPGQTLTRSAVWEPPVDVVETETDYLVTVALPGVEATDIDIATDPPSVIVESRQPAAVRLAVRAVHRLEIPYGRFERRIDLPSEAFELQQYEFANGCLRIILRKR